MIIFGGTVLITLLVFIKFSLEIGSVALRGKMMGGKIKLMVIITAGKCTKFQFFYTPYPENALYEDVKRRTLEIP